MVKDLTNGSGSLCDEWGGGVGVPIPRHLENQLVQY